VFDIIDLLADFEKELNDLSLPRVDLVSVDFLAIDPLILTSVDLLALF